MKRLTIISLIIICFSACYKEVPIVLLNFQPRIVVNGLISTKDSSFVQVSRSIASTDSSFIPFISNATVRILDENGNVFENLVYSPFESKYFGLKSVQRGVRYSVQVTVNGETATGTTRILETAKLDYLIYKDSVGLDSSLFPVGELSFAFTDLPGQDNYYRLRLEAFDKNTQLFRPVNLDDDEFIDARAENTIKGYVFNDNTFRGKQQRIAIPVEFGLVDKSAPYSFRVSLEVLNEDYTKYEDSRRLFQRSNGLFSTEPVEIFSNIKNGLGIFAGSALVQDTLRN